LSHWRASAVAFYKFVSCTAGDQVRPVYSGGWFIA
jgi:hypothetical protein